MIHPQQRLQALLAFAVLVLSGAFIYYSKMASPAYSLLYWPGIPGRGEFIRLALEATGTKYNDVKDPSKFTSLIGPDHDHFAPPILRLERENATLISQTPNILMYLGQELDLAGEKSLDKYTVNQLALTLLDINNEAHDTHHPVAVSQYYEDQKEESLKKAADFRANRIPKYMGYFEGLIKSNPAGYLHGSKLTYADLVLFQVVDGLKFAFPKAMESYESKMTNVLGLYEKVKEVQGIKDYLKSGRREKFSMGVYRYYEELDGPI